MFAITPAQRARIILFIAFALLLTVTSGARAAAPSTDTHESTGLACDGLVTAAGVVRLTGAVSSVAGPTGFMAVWIAPADPATSPPTWLSLGMDASLSPDGTTLTATYDLYEIGDPGLADAGPIFIGTASLTATLTPDGDPEVVDERYQDGNHRTAISGTRQGLFVTGTLELPDGSNAPLDGCSGRAESLTITSTQPASTVTTAHVFILGCSWATEAGFVDLSVTAFPGTGAQAVLVVFDGTDVHVGVGAPQLTRRSVEATLDLAAGDGLGTGNAVVSSVLQQIGVEHVGTGSPGYRQTEHFRTLAPRGELSYTTPGSSGSLVLDDQHCFAFSIDVHSAEKPPSDEDSNNSRTRDP